MIAKSRKQMKLLTTGVEEYIRDYLEKNKTLFVTRVCGVGYFVALTILGGLCTLAAFKYNQLNLSYQKLQAENTGLKQQIHVIKEEKDALVHEYDAMYNSYSDLVAISSELETENKEVSAAYEAQSAELQKFQEREELYDKYEYALIREEDGSRTDINYDDLKSLEGLAKEKGIPDDAISLILNIANIESHYYADAQNSSSSAAGLCGLVKGTAKTIYNNELGAPQGTYKHNPMAYDSELNLQIGLALVDYLSEENNGDALEVMKDYMGEDNKAYLNKLDKLLKNNVNKSLYNLQL